MGSLALVKQLVKEEKKKDMRDTAKEAKTDS